MRPETVLLIFGLSVLAVFNYFFLRFFSDRYFDDAYIHLSIAREIFRSGLPYFNSGEPVMVSSSQAWTWALAGFFKIFGMTESVLPLIENVALMMLILSSYFLFRNSRTVWVSWLGALIIGYVIALNICIGGMETPLTVSFILASFYFFEKKKETYGVALLVIATFFRYESTVFLIGSSPLWFKNSKSRWTVWVGAAVFTGYCLFFFGTLIPQPMIAKSIVFFNYWRGALGPLLQRDMITFMNHGIAGRSQIFWTRLTWGTNFLYFVAGCIFLIVGRALYLFKIKTVSVPSLILLFSGFLLFCIYAFSNIYISPWYSLLWSIPFIAGGLTLIKKDLVLHCLLFLVVGYRIPDFYLLLSSWAEGDSAGYGYSLFNSRTDVYKKVAQRIQGAMPNASIYTSEIGALRWYSNLKLIDGLGIATPASLDFQPVIKGPRPSKTAIPAEMVLKYRPDYIVSMASLTEDLLSRIRTNQNDFPYSLDFEVALPRDFLFVKDSTVFVYRRNSANRAGSI